MTTTCRNSEMLSTVRTGMLTPQNLQHSEDTLARSILEHASEGKRERFKSATVYWRGSGRVRFPRRSFDALLATIAALNCFVVGIGHSRFPSDLAIKHIQRSLAT